MRPFVSALLVLTSSVLTTACGPVLISDKNLSHACATAADCVAIFVGDACSVCQCGNAAIASSAKAQYDKDLAAAQAFCGPRPAVACDCAPSNVQCAQGACLIVP